MMIWGVVSFFSNFDEAVLTTLAVPAISKGRDQNDVQDMYRRALAASWAAQPDELPADQCIEDIFSGGDGWKGGYAKVSKAAKKNKDDELADLKVQRHNRNQSDASLNSLNSQSTIKAHSRLGHKHSRSREIGHSAGLQNGDDQHSSTDSERGRLGFRSAHEVDEFDLLEDLIAWRLPGKVSS